VGDVTVHQAPQSLYGQEMLHDSWVGLEVDGAMDSQAIPPAAWLDRNRHIPRRPAADRAHRVGWVYRIHEDRGFIGGHLVQQRLGRLR